MTPRTRSAPNKPISPTDDNNGNLETRSQSCGDSWSYAFNARNELTQVVKNAQTQATFTYDPAGRRVKSVETATIHYAFSGGQVLYERMSAQDRRRNT